jgi:hypothetical protein
VAVAVAAVAAVAVVAVVAVVKSGDNLSGRLCGSP